MVLSIQNCFSCAWKSAWAKISIRPTGSTFCLLLFFSHCFIPWLKRVLICVCRCLEWGWGTESLSHEKGNVYYYLPCGHQSQRCHMLGLLEAPQVNFFFLLCLKHTESNICLCRAPTPGPLGPNNGVIKHPQSICASPKLGLPIWNRKTLKRSGLPNQNCFSSCVPCIAERHHLITRKPAHQPPPLPTNPPISPIALLPGRPPWHRPSSPRVTASDQAPSIPRLMLPSPLLPHFHLFPHCNQSKYSL